MFSNLPADILKRIFSFLPSNTKIIRYREIDKTLSNLLKDNYFWEKLFCQYFPEQYSTLKSQLEKKLILDEDWCFFFKDRYSIYVGSYPTGLSLPQKKLLSCLKENNNEAIETILRDTTSSFSSQMLVKTPWIYHPFFLALQRNNQDFFHQVYHAWVNLPNQQAIDLKIYCNQALTDDEAGTVLHNIANLNNEYLLSPVLLFYDLSLFKQGEFDKDFYIAFLENAMKGIINLLIEHNIPHRLKELVDLMPFLITRICDDPQDYQHLYLKYNLDLLMSYCRLAEKHSHNDLIPILLTDVLLIYIELQKFDKAQQLIEMGVSIVNINEKAKQTIFTSNSPNVIDFLVKNNFDLQKVGENNLLMDAIYFAEIPIISECLIAKYGFHINGVYPYIDAHGKNHNFTPLLLATYFLETSQKAIYLINQGAEVNAMDDENNIPLHHAMMNVADIQEVQEDLDTDIIKNHFSLISLLLEKGANINAVNKSGQTPLHIVVIEIDTEDMYSRNLILFLIQKGADVTLVDNEDKSVANYLIDIIETISKSAMDEASKFFVNALNNILQNNDTLSEEPKTKRRRLNNYDPTFAYSPRNNQDPDNDNQSNAHFVPPRI